MSSNLFVSGTDTNVGKTLVSALLALKLRSQGLDCGVMKPFSAGCEWQNGVLVNEDAVFLREIAGVDDDLELINPIRLEKPLAPLMAARRAEISSQHWFSQAREAFEELQKRHDFLIVEGAGGLLVPLAERDGQVLTCADLAREWDLPTVIVARRTLGTINHTLLTCREPEIRFVGLVFSDAAPVLESDVAARESPNLLAEMTGLPIWGQIPFLETKNAAILEKIAAKLEIEI